jgi:hypothetical protein
MNELEKSVEALSINEELMTNVRELAERITVLEECVYESQRDSVKQDHYSAFDKDSVLGLMAPDQSTGRFSDFFGSDYDRYHASPIIVDTIGDGYRMNPNYAAELQAVRSNRDVYDEAGNLKTTVIAKSVDVSGQPLFNRSLPTREPTIEDQIDALIRVSGERPEPYFKAVAEIKNRKVEKILELMNRSPIEDRE